MNRSAFFQRSRFYHWTWSWSVNLALARYAKSISFYCCVCQILRYDPLVKSLLSNLHRACRSCWSYNDHQIQPESDKRIIFNTIIVYVYIFSLIVRILRYDHLVWRWSLVFCVMIILSEDMWSIFYKILLCMYIHIFLTWSWSTVSQSDSVKYAKII